MARSIVRYDKHRWPLCAAELSLQELGHARWLFASGVGGFKAEPGRYHLYVSLARLPMGTSNAHFPKAQGAYGHDRLLVVHRLMLENGWTFMDGPGVIPDPLYGARFLYEIYTRAEPRYTGRVTVPVPMGQGDQDHR